METTNAFALVKELGKFDISLKICGFTLMIDVIGLLPLSDGFRESKLLSSAVILAPGNCCFSFSTFFVGVVSEVFYKTEYASLSSVPIPVRKKQSVEMQEMIDLGIVIKSSEVQKLVKEVIKKITR